jgi:hypothetical protein
MFLDLVICKHAFTKECEWVVYVDIYNGLYKSVFCSTLYKERYKEAHAAAPIEHLNIPNQDTRLRVQHLFVNNEFTGICKT